MKFITNLSVRMGVLRDDLDYDLIRASMVIERRNVGSS